MAAELVLDASVSLAWFLKETSERAAYAAAVSAAAAEGAVLHVDIRVHVELVTARRVVELAKRYQLQGYDALYFGLAKSLSIPLATLDNGHRQAAKQHAVSLFLSA
jgi:predicted nucleic acid-binding protein